jgi:hypothetical protein
MNAYSKLELSAYGAGDGGGGGGGGGIIETVYGYGNLGQTFNNNILTDTFNAYTINQINTRLASVENGSATTVNTTGTGNAITSISKSGSVITASKDLTFSLSGHTHTISDVTGLQTALNSKLETSIFNTHNTDNVRHITGAERTKWDKVVTDFGNLEIGGRNYWAVAKNAEHTYLKYEGDYVFSNNTSASALAIFRMDELNVPLNKQYTITFEIKVTNENIQFQNDVYYVNSALSVQHNRPQLIVDEWVKVEASFYYAIENTSYTHIYIIGATGINQYEIRNFNLKQGTIPTDWTPAPEDQVSDWLTTDVNSFSFIKNKPTSLSQFTDNIGVATHIANTSNPHNVTKAQVGLGNVDNTSDTNKPISTATQNALNLKANLASPTFTGTVTAPTFIGALTGNATSATALQTARTIWGQSFNGGSDVSGAMTGVATLAMTGALSGATTIAASTSVTTPKVIFAAAGWSMEQVGSELQMKYNGTAKMRFLSGGSIVATQEITAYQ